MTSHKVTDFCTERFSVCPSITSKFRAVTILKLRVKNKTMIQMKLVGVSTIFYCTNHNLHNCGISWVISIKKIRILTLNDPPDSYFCKFSWSHLDWLKFCIHLMSLHVCNFGMVVATSFKNVESRSAFMTWRLHCISWKSTKWFESYWWGTHREPDWQWSHKPRLPLVRKVG
jgi:hypothetical protein